MTNERFVRFLYGLCFLITLISELAQYFDLHWYFGQFDLVDNVGNSAWPAPLVVVGSHYVRILLLDTGLASSLLVAVATAVWIILGESVTPCLWFGTADARDIPIIFFPLAVGFLRARSRAHPHRAEKLLVFYALAGSAVKLLYCVFR